MLMILISHLHQLDPLAAPGVVPEVDEHVGVEGEFEAEWDHKDCQENDSEVRFLQCIGPPTEVTDTLIMDVIDTKRTNCLLSCNLKDKKARDRREQRGNPCCGNQSKILCSNYNCMEKRQH